MENRGEKNPPRDGRKGGARQSLPGEKLSVTPTKSLMVTLGVPEPQNVWRNNNIPKKDQERSQEDMRNENNSKKAWQEAVERVGQADQSFGMKGSRTSWECSSAHTSQQGWEWEKELWRPQNPLGFGVVLSRRMGKQCTTNSTWNLGFLLLEKMYLIKTGIFKKPYEHLKSKPTKS